jgi:hypothetical protein
VTVGYFSNGTEGEMYEEQWCSRCVHDDPDRNIFCPVLMAHHLWNYTECMKPDSVLHKMIPRETFNDGGIAVPCNGRCFAFTERKA